MAFLVRLTLVTLAGIAVSRAAWFAPVLSNVCNSAPAPGGQVEVNADVKDSVGLGAGWNVTAKLFYSLDGQATWHELDMVRIQEPGFDSTFAARFAVPSGGAVCYYVRADNGVGFGTQSPCNSANVWPTSDNLFAAVAAEPTGDTVNNPRGEYLDLTGAGMSYSADWFYARLTNHHNSWPFNAGPLGPWFVYSLGFKNPDAATDSLGYSLTYVDVAGIYTSGLYEVNTYTSTFTRVGDVETNTSGNRLLMRCRVSDLAARSGFQPWPNVSGYLRATRGDARSANLLLESWVHDSTNYGRLWVNRTPGFTIGQNRPPSLTRPRVVPGEGTPETDFWFNISYADPDSHLPVRRAVVVDDETLALTPSGHRYWMNTLYGRTERGFAPGWHRFRFVFDDGMDVVATEPDSFRVTGTGVAELPAGARAAAAVPNPFATRVEVRFPRLVRMVSVLSSSGRLVRTLLTEGVTTWDGRDREGRPVPPGVYYLLDRDRILPGLRVVKLAAK